MKLRKLLSTLLAAALLGRSPSAVANKLRLLRLSPACRGCQKGRGEAEGTGRRKGTGAGSRG